MYLLKSSNAGGGIFTTPIVVTSSTTPTSTSSPHRQILLPPVSTVHLSSSSASSVSLSQSINSHDFCTEAYFKTNESSSSSHDFVISKTIEDVTDPGILLDDVTDGVVGGRLQHKHNTISTSSHDEGIEETDVGVAVADTLLFDDISAAIEAINAANRLNSSYTDDICDDTGNVDDDNDDDVVGESIDTTTGIIVQQSQNIPTIATLHPIGLSACSTSTSSGLDQFITHSMFVNIPMTSNSTTTTTTTMPSMIDYHQSPGLLFNSNNNNDNNNNNNNNNNTHAYIQIVKKQDSLTNTSHGSVTTTTAGSCTTNIDISSSNSSAIRIPPLLTTTPRPMKNTSSMTSSSLSQSNWRFLLRPIFEKILIEKLWTSGELGASNPYSLLLSMWFFISRYFGIGCRTDHAKLAYGNIIIERNTETGERYLRFTSLPPGTRSPGSGSGYGTLRRLSKLGKELSTCQVKPRHPDTRLLECQSRPDRCPVRLYEAFCSHRPCSTTTIHSPFYLQPDRAAASIHYYHRQHPSSSSSSFSFSTNTNSSIWFTLNALGKNKIGSMLNGALQSIGMPVGRQVNLTRFCDSLIAAVLSLPSSSTSSSLNSNNNNNSISGGECDGDAGDLTREAYRVSEALRSILSNNRLIIPYQQIPESLQPTVTSLAEKVVQLSATRGSPIYNYLAKLSALKKSINNNNNNNKKTVLKKTNVKKLGKVSSKFLFPSDDDDYSDGDGDDDDEDADGDDTEGHQDQETTDPNKPRHQQQHQLVGFTDHLSHSTVNTSHHCSITSTTNSTSTEMNIDNQRPLKSSSSDSSLPTMVPMNIFYNSKHIDDCYSDHPSLGNGGMDDDGDVDDDIDGDIEDDDDVGIDSFDLNQSDLSLNNNNNLHNNQIRTGIGTTNNNVDNTTTNDDITSEMMNSNNNNNKGGNYCLTNGKISPPIMQENINLGITQNYPFGNIIQTHGQTLIDLASGQLFQLQPQNANQQQQQLLNNSTDFLLTCPNSTNGNINGVLGNVNISSSLSPTVIFVPATTYTTAQNNRMELTCGGGVGLGVGGASSSVSPNQGTGSSISAALPLDESMIDISRLGGIENLMPSTAVMFSPSTLIKQPPPECIAPQCLVDVPVKQDINGNGISSNNNNSNSDKPVRCLPIDDIRIDLRKTGGGSGRSVKLELRELLDLVLTSASYSPNPIVLADSGKIYTPHPGTSQRPPVGLVTQLLWRARALDDRGPWILTFSMWWLMQHYFGIGSRMHHVRLRWGHVRLVHGVIDPMTGELCDAIEYVGPSNFTTVKACALPESNPTTTTSGRESSSVATGAGAPASGSVIRRVYPSSGWAEPEITVATALSTESKANRPRVRPLYTDPSVPPVPPRSGPDFVALYKSFIRYRQEASLLPDSPFYVQPLQNSSAAYHSKTSIIWFSIGALGKNRIGALMRNIVDKVVRPDMPKVATAALSAATSACVIAADRAAMALTDNHCVGVGVGGNTGAKMPSSDLSSRQQSLVDKLSCLLGTNMSNMMMSSESPTKKININTNSHTNNTHTNTNNNGGTVIISRLDNPETNLLLLSPTSSGGVMMMQQALPTTVTSTSTATDIVRSPNHFLLKLPKLVTPTASTIINTSTTTTTNTLVVSSDSSSRSLSMSSMIAPLLSTQPPAAPQVLRNQIVYETSSSAQQPQQSQVQCPSLVFTTQPHLQQQQQQQQQYQQQHHQSQQTFIQDTDRTVMNPVNQLGTNTTTFLLLTTVDGQTFLAPAGGCFGGFNTNNNNNNQSPGGGGYILLQTATSTANHSTNVVTPGSTAAHLISQIEHTDPVQQQQQQQQQSSFGQYHQVVQSSINTPMLIYGSGGGGGYSPMKGQNMMVSPYQLTTVMGTTSIPVTPTTTTTTTTTTAAITRSLVTPRTFQHHQQQQQHQHQQQPIAYHLTSNPTSSSSNSLPVNVILLSNNPTSNSLSTSPILLSNNTTPAVVHSQSAQLPSTIYQTENRCDFDFSVLYSARETSAVNTTNTTTVGSSSMTSTIGQVDSSFQPLIIQRNDSSNMAIRRTITLMNSGNPLTVVNNNNNNSGATSMTSRQPVVGPPSSSTTTTTTTTSVLPACNQILCGRSSLQQSQPQLQPPPPAPPPPQHLQQTQLPVLFDTSTSSVLNTNSVTSSGSATTALLQLNPMKTGYQQTQNNNSLIQALSCGQLIAITQPVDGGGGVGSNGESVVVGGSVLQPVVHHHNQMQQHQLINSSSDLITGGQQHHQQHQHQQPTITILPIGNNTTALSNNNNNNGIKPDLYFELPMIDGGDQNTNSNNTTTNNNNNPGQTVYRLLCTDNSTDRTFLTNGLISSNNNEINRLVFINTTHNQNNHSSSCGLSETMNSIFTTENSLYPPPPATSAVSSTAPPTSSSSSTTPSSMITTNDHHYLIDHFPNVIVNQQHQQQPLINGGYASLASPQSSVSSSSSSSLSSASASSMMSMKTTLSSSSSGTGSAVGSRSGSSLLLVSTANPTISSSILQSPKISLLTTSKLKKDQDTMDNNNNPNNNANCTTSVMMNNAHLLNSGHFIKGDDDNQYLRPPTILTIMTINPTKREQEFNNDMSNNNNTTNNKGNTNNNSNSNNNFLSTLPSLSSMTCHLIPIEPKPEQLKTLQSVINSASAFQCSDFPAYVEQLFRKGILSGLRPWCLNFTAWFINTLVFEVENRTEHVSLRWGDFRLCKTADGRIEYIYFINRITNKRYYLASSPTSCCALGYNRSELDNKSLNEPPVRCPCPVTIFKALRDRRPTACLDPYSKFYLQPRNVECPEANAIEEIHDRVQKCHLLPAYSNWFTEHAWGKNKLGGLFAEASRLAGLPTIWLRKHRSRNFFPGGGGSGIGALGNHQQKKRKTVEEKNNNNENPSTHHQFTSRENDIGNDDEGDDDNDDEGVDDDDDDDGNGGHGGEENHFDDVILDGDHTSRSKENNNNNDDLSMHTEVKRRCILNTVKNTTNSISISIPATANSTTFIYNQQEGSCITTVTGTTTPTTANSVNILPSSMTILKPKEIIYTSTVNQ